MHGISKGTGFRLFVVVAWMVMSLSISWSFELPAAPFSKLKAEEFRIREGAQAELLAWAREQREPAVDELFRQSRVADDPEVRERCLAVLRELVNDEYLKQGEGYLGISMQQANEIVTIPGDPKPRMGVKVVMVMPESAAHRAGLQFNDVIAGLGNEAWHEGVASKLFSDKIRQMKPDTKVTLKVVRNGNVMDLEVKLGKRPIYADLQFQDERQLDLAAAERAAREDYFRRWLDRKKSGK